MKLKIGTITNMIVHYIGNKYREEGVSFSKKETQFNIVEEDLMTTICNNFENNDMYEFFFEPDLNMNHVYSFIKTIFHNKNRFIEQSNLLAKILYEQSNIPQIKGGELCILYLEKCQCEGKLTDAIALLKVEKKQPVVRYVRESDGFRIEKSEAVNISKIDKGCVIFNVDEESGYKVVVVDNNSSKQTAIYWKDNFLHIRSCMGAFHQTKLFINIIKDFVTDNMKEDKVTKALAIAKSKKILIESKSIDIKNFAKNAFADEQTADNFVNYFARRIDKYEKIPTDLCIENKLAQPKSAMPSIILHLDSNFDIKVYGGDEMIMHGYDETAGMNYYKLYYIKDK